MKIKLKPLLVKRFNIAFYDREMQSLYKYDTQQVIQFIEELKQKRLISNFGLIAEEKNFNKWFRDKKGFLPEADYLPMYSFNQLYLKNKTKLSEKIFCTIYAFVLDRITSEDVNMILVSAVQNLDEYQEELGFPTSYEEKIKNYWNKFGSFPELHLEGPDKKDQLENFVDFLDEAILFLGIIKYINPRSQFYFKELYLKGMS